MNVYNTIQKMVGLGHQGSRDCNVTATTNKAHNLALQRGFSGGGKKRVRYTTYLREISELREDRANDYGGN